MATAKKTDTSEVEVLEIQTRRVEFCLLGQTPLLMNRFSEKARREMMLPALKKNRAEKSSSLKHDPVAEYRAAAYRNRDPNSDAFFHMPTGAFHKAIGQAAIDIPGQAKSVMLRLTSIASVNVDLFGIPQLHISMVRSGGMASVPDMRTRPCFREWACSVQFDLISNLVSERQITALIAAAGMICGVGDWRPQKGGSNGKFALVSPDDKDFQRIVNMQGRNSQIEAFENPGFFDEESQELFEWFSGEADRRELPYTKMGQSEFLMAAE
jgi:hypothetical protein